MLYIMLLPWYSRRVLKSTVRLNDGIINLVDKFFEMPRHEAIKSLEIYRRACQQAGSLSDFYEVCKVLELARNFQFPVLREPPQSFLATMEEYIGEAARVVSIPNQQLEFPERLLLTYKPQEALTPDDAKAIIGEEPQPVASDNVGSSNIEAAINPSPANHLDTGDLLGLNDFPPDALTIEESNALALSIVPSDIATTSQSGTATGKEFDPSGWELALVTTPSSNISSVNEQQLSGGLDSLTLNSLYGEAFYWANQRPAYGPPAPNQFEVQDPFAKSNNIAAPPAVQMAAMTQQQQLQFFPFGPYQLPYQQWPHQLQPNPFSDLGFGAFPSNPVALHNPFGSTGLL